MAEGSTRAAGAHVLVDGVSRTFPGGVRALSGVSFAVDPGELVLLTGRSGAGKSTVLNLVGALDRPDAGRILVDGTDLRELGDLARYRREVAGHVFQLHHLLGDLSAAENVELPLIPVVHHERERARRARAALEDVGITGRASHRPAQLSGGERQRVAVARALVNAPRLLLADEPTASLDEQSAAELLALFAELRERRGMTVLLVSHDPLARAHATRVLTLHDGALVSPAPPQGAAA